MEQKNNKKQGNGFERLADLTAKELTIHKPGYFIVNGDERILMPMQVASMRAGLSKIQQNIVLAVIEGLKKELLSMLDAKHNVRQMDLFAEQEEKDDARPIKLKIMFSNFGVEPRHYQQLAEAMIMMSRIPVEISNKGASGTEYYKFTNFCTVYIPKERKRRKYCIVSMENDVAEQLLRFDPKYFYVGKLTSWRMASRYSERLYWYVKSYLNHGGVTITMSDLRKMFGIENKFERFSMFERKVLKSASDEMKNLFDKGECECWFTYKKIYNDDRKKGEPDAIAFKVYGRTYKKLENTVDEKDDAVLTEIRDTMLTDLGMPESLADKYMKMVTDANKNSFLAQLITLKAQLDQKIEDKKPVKKRTAYVTKAINNFFENSEKERVSSIIATRSTVCKGKYDNMTYTDRWVAIIQQLRSYRSDEQMRETFDNVSFDTFDPHNGSLVLCVVGRDVCERIENDADNRNLLSRLLNEYFSQKSMNWRVFSTREDMLKYKRSKAIYG